MLAHPVSDVGQQRHRLGPQLFTVWANGSCRLCARPTWIWVGPILVYCIGQQWHRQGPQLFTVWANGGCRLCAWPTWIWAGPMLVYCVSQHQYIWSANNDMGRTHDSSLYGPMVVVDLIIGQAHSCSLSRPTSTYMVGRQWHEQDPWLFTVWADGSQTLWLAGPMVVHWVGQHPHIVWANNLIDWAHTCSLHRLISTYCVGQQCYRPGSQPFTVWADHGCRPCARPTWILAGPMCVYCLSWHDHIVWADLIIGMAHGCSLDEPMVPAIKYAQFDSKHTTTDHMVIIPAN